MDFTFPIVLLVLAIVVFASLLAVAGYFMGGKGVALCGLVIIIGLIAFSYYLPWYCDSLGTEPGQSFEGCGNVVGFYFWIISAFVAPALAATMAVLTVIICLMFRNRTVARH